MRSIKAKKLKAPITAQLQASADAAAVSGGVFLLALGESPSGPLFASRMAGIQGSGGTAAGSVLVAHYSSLGGVPGEDAMITLLDDGVKGHSLNPQPILSNFSIDGRTGTQPAGHIRHGIVVPKPTPGKSDRAPKFGDVYVVAMPGHGVVLDQNDQLRGGDFKTTDCDWIGIVAYSLADGKIDRTGTSNKGGGFLYRDCSSFKIGKADGWMPPGCLGTLNGERVWLGRIESCKNFSISDGELAGAVLVTGDNHKPNNRACGWNVDVTFDGITFKPSVAYKQALGDAYRGHVTIRDAFGVRLPGTGFGAGKGDLDDPEVAAIMAARPPFAICFETAADPAGKNYLKFLQTAGSCDCEGIRWLAYPPVLSDNPEDSSPARTGYYENTSDRPELLYNVGPGTHRLLVRGMQGPNEVESSGQELTSNYFPILYVRLAHGRKFTDRELTGPGADPVTGWKTFMNSNLNAEMPPPPDKCWYVSHY